MSSSSNKLSRMGEEIWKTRTDKVSAELVTLTYGTLVTQLLQDFPATPVPSSTFLSYHEVNGALDKIGYNIGIRMIEDFFARSGLPRCATFRDTADTIARVGFKSFLNVTPRVEKWSEDGRGFSLVLGEGENPLAEFVELPEDCLGRASRGASNESEKGGEDDDGDGVKGEGLWYSNVLCGVLRGALEMVQMRVEAKFVSDTLQGDETTEIRVTLLSYIEDEMPPDDE